MTLLVLGPLGHLEMRNGKIFYVTLVVNLKLYQKLNESWSLRVVSEMLPSVVVFMSEQYYVFFSFYQLYLRYIFYTVSVTSVTISLY
jgi:hypothetical protein